MTKFQKAQKLSSIIPYFSSFIVFIVTMFELKRKKASTKVWIFFALIFFLAGSVVYALNLLILIQLHPFLSFLISGLILAPANLLCVDLQVKCAQTENPPKPSSMNKTTMIICISIGALLVVIILIAMFLSPSIEIADSNGENDTSLAVLTMDDLLSDKDNYSAYFTHYSYSGSETNVNGILEEMDRDVCRYSAKKISGTITLQATKTTNDSMTLEITSDLTVGNAEIIVMIDGEYYSHIATNKTDTIVLEKISGKLVIVRMGTESAAISVSVKRTLE